MPFIPMHCLYLYQLHRFLVPEKDLIGRASVTQVCIDCQQHAIYKDQFRAMFVLQTVRVKTNEILRQQQVPSGRGKKKQRKGRLRRQR